MDRHRIPRAHAARVDRALGCVQTDCRLPPAAGIGTEILSVTGVSATRPSVPQSVSFSRRRTLEFLFLSRLRLVELPVRGNIELVAGNRIGTDLRRLGRDLEYPRGTRRLACARHRIRRRAWRRGLFRKEPTDQLGTKGAGSGARDRTRDSTAGRLCSRVTRSTSCGTGCRPLRRACRFAAAQCSPPTASETTTLSG